MTLSIFEFKSAIHYIGSAKLILLSTKKLYSTLLILYLFIYLYETWPKKIKIIHFEIDIVVMS